MRLILRKIATEPLVAWLLYNSSYLCKGWTYYSTLCIYACRQHFTFADENNLISLFALNTFIYSTNDDTSRVMSWTERSNYVWL